MLILAFFVTIGSVGYEYYFDLYRIVLPCKKCVNMNKMIVSHVIVLVVIRIPI